MGASKGTGRLSNPECARATPESKLKKLTDGEGLYLAVLPSGVKSWRIKYRFGGAGKTYSAGQYPEVGLAEARQRRDEVRRLLRDGKDPVAERRKVRDAPQQPAADATTFKAVAEDYLSRKAYSFHHNRELRRILADDLGPDIGSIDVAEIDTPTLLTALRKIEDRGHLETLAKARRFCSQVFRYSIATGSAKADPTLPIARDVFKTPDVQHRATIKGSEFPALLKALAAVPAELNSKLAIYWVMLTACRTSEMRFAPWSEIDGDAWVIPAGRMKMKRDHMVPLSSQAKAVLEAAQPLRTSPEHSALIFPGFSRSGHLSENALLALLARAGYYGRQTAHGFRAAFSTWAHEVAEADVDVIEACLAHVQGGVRGVYNRALYLPQRRELLQRWGDQLSAWGMRLQP